jgi:methylated-DNA-protein-cysteine methyltransferase-like protein
VPSLRNSPPPRRTKRAGGERTSYLRIWSAVSRIPRGRVSTYGRIAVLCRLPGQARLVGYALHGLPHGTGVPWQRVINARGEISFERDSRAWQEQRRLLEKEGVHFINDRVDLIKRGWPRPWR